MDLDNDLSVEERRLAAELSRLVAGPSPRSRAAIMQAVRDAQQERRGHPARRLMLAAVLAALLLVATAVGAFAASSDAVPSSPAYPIRTFGEQFRIALATPAEREQLRISFANARTSQARATLSHGKRADASALLRDSKSYLQQTKQNLGSLPANQQGQIQNQLNQAEADEHEVESELETGDD